jgi:predicted nuclease of restriction endonuclease-like (RecB) superfamily
LGLNELHKEKELEDKIILHLEKVLYEFGEDFAILGNIKIDPDVDEALNALFEDLVTSQQVSKLGWIISHTFGS